VIHDCKYISLSCHHPRSGALDLYSSGCEGGAANRTVGEASSFIVPRLSDRPLLKDKSKSVVRVERRAIENLSLPLFCPPSGFPAPSLTVAQSCSSRFPWVTSHSTRGMAAVKLSEIPIIAIAASYSIGCAIILFFVFRFAAASSPPHCLSSSLWYTAGKGD